MARLNGNLDAYSQAITRELVGVRPGQPAPIVGDPVKAAGLDADLVITRRS